MPGPIPPYSNLPINANYYKPSRFVVSNITLGLSTVVTTSEDNNYVIGQLVRLLVPEQYGSYQLNNVAAYVLSIPSADQVELALDSRDANAFISSPPTQTQNLTPPQIMAIGDINSGQTNTGRSNQATYVPGSFINISPQ